MSYIPLKGTEEEQKTLQDKNDKLLSDIRKIVGNKKFTFSDEYAKRVYPCIGVGDRLYTSVTKTYVYVNCFVQYSTNKDLNEYGAYIKKFPICYQRGSGEFVKKVALKDLFIEDLEKILNDLKFYLWWQAEVKLPKIKEEYEKALACQKEYEKMLKNLGCDPDKDIIKY